MTDSSNGKQTGTPIDFSDPEQTKAALHGTARRIGGQIASFQVALSEAQDDSARLGAVACMLEAIAGTQLTLCGALFQVVDSQSRRVAAVADPLLLSRRPG